VNGLERLGVEEEDAVAGEAGKQVAARAEVDAEPAGRRGKASGFNRSAGAEAPALHQPGVGDVGNKRVVLGEEGAGEGGAGGVPGKGGAVAGRLQVPDVDGAGASAQGEPAGITRDGDGAGAVRDETTLLDDGARREGQGAFELAGLNVENGDDAGKEWEGTALAEGELLAAVEVAEAMRAEEQRNGALLDEVHAGEDAASVGSKRQEVARFRLDGGGLLEQVLTFRTPAHPAAFGQLTDAADESEVFVGVGGLLGGSASLHGGVAGAGAFLARLDRQAGESI